MNTYYDQLMKFKGAEELQELIKRWEILSENINKRSFDAPIILPDLFIYTKPGYGNTNLINLLAEYLDSKKNLMSFYGDVKFFEFKLEYCKPSDKFQDLYRLIDSVEAAAGFRNEFKGIIRINVDEWVGHHKEKHFLDFLQFLQINTAYWLVLLTISNHTENEETKDMEGVVSMYLRIEKITLHMPSDVELIEYASQHLAKYGLELDESAKKLLTESISLLRNNKYFYGLHTITDLCNDIVYSVFSKSTNVNNVIKADMLTDFSAESDYIKRTVAKIKKTMTLGFV
ncbi:MAG: hypothetical protein E7551_05105 [Ruminococcaceae bacterium]|nr:hypothetical protein [Oscillospiraceae bacterium]